MTAATRLPTEPVSGSLDLVHDRERARLLMHPLRQRILRAMETEAMSAAETARRLGVARQKVNYHVNELARGGFLEETDERRRGNLVERRYRATARGWVLAPEVLGRLAPRELPAEDAVSAARLLGLSARLQSELGRVLRGAEGGGRRVSTFSLDAELRFRSAKQRAAFADALEEAVLDVMARHASPFAEADGSPGPGEPYRLVLGCHPIPEDDEETENE